MHGSVSRGPAGELHGPPRRAAHRVLTNGGMELHKGKQSTGSREERRGMESAGAQQEPKDREGRGSTWETPTGGGGPNRFCPGLVAKGSGCRS